MVILTAGDIALTLGVGFAWIKFGVFSSLLSPPSGQTIADPFSFDVVSQGVIATLHRTVAGTGPRAILVMGIVFLVAAAVRSAQFPFTTWLTDAASSAAPVLALASATVAPLGIFLVARIYPVVAHAPRALPVLALVGGVSAMLTAATGIAQHSITRIAACAVASELGLGMVALGMGGYGAGVFIGLHLRVHVDAPDDGGRQPRPRLPERRHRRDGRGMVKAAHDQRRPWRLGAACRRHRLRRPVHAVGVRD